MNDFQDRVPVHQVVFRWDGNQGRQDTGMHAVAHSCEAGRAEELGRELGSLLWVSGAAAARPSVVRMLSRDGDVLLVQRWPTKDRGGRPSTVSHVLVGDHHTLSVDRCLGLAQRGWRTQERAEQASGRLAEFDCADLQKLARGRLPGMLERLPEVEYALILAGAELLRDPRQRVSLLLEERTPENWPDPGMVPVVYLGLFLIFGSWLDQEWTFATYDTVDSHPLRLMSVPRWEEDTGGSGPLARVRGRRPERFEFEHKAAAQLVTHLLEHPGAEPGVPQLVEKLPDGASLDWDRRSARLRKILGPDRQERGRVRERAGERERQLDRTAAPSQATAPTPAAPQAYPAPPAPPYEEPYGQPYANPSPQPYANPQPQPQPYASPQPQPQPHLQPFPPPAAAHGPNGHDTYGHDTYGLHQDLRDNRNSDSMRRGYLMARLTEQSDQVLYQELTSGELSPDSLDLVLRELGRAHRVEARHPDMRHALCAVVLDNDLFFRPEGPDAEHMSRKAMVDRASDVFTWAVAPLARDERYLSRLGEVLDLMAQDSHPTTGNWVRQTIIEPAGGPIPDLHPVLWSQLLCDEISRNNRPRLPPPSTFPAPAPMAPMAPPRPPDHMPDQTGITARLSDLINKPGCFIGSLAVLGTLLLGLVVMLFI